MAPTAPSVLLGEPDLATSELYQRALSAGFAVVTAGDEQTLLYELRTHPLAGVILEPAIFRVRSWEQTELIGRLCAARQIRLVICSTRDERQRARELGATSYLVKPTLPATLLETLRKVLAGQGDEHVRTISGSAR